VEAQLLLANASYPAGSRSRHKGHRPGHQPRPEPESKLHCPWGDAACQRKNAEAETAFQRAISLDLTNVRAHIAYGYYLWATRQLPAAEEELKAALELDPNGPLANRLLVMLYISTGRSPKAEPYLKTLAKSGPDAVLNLADYYTAANRLDEALAALRPLVSSQGVGRLARLRMASIAFMQGRKDEANRSVDDLLKNDPNNPAALLVKARFLLAENRLERRWYALARRWLLTREARWPNSSWAGCTSSCTTPRRRSKRSTWSSS
jgi:tetratricopeptide (TPR) repeat protein